MTSLNLILLLILLKKAKRLIFVNTTPPNHIKIIDSKLKVVIFKRRL